MNEPGFGRKLWHQLRHHLRQSAVPLLVGMALGALIFGVRWTGAAGDDSGPSHPAARGPSPSERAQWTCSMHPQIRQSEPGSCPLCGMDLVPVTNSSTDQEAGPARVTLSPRAKKLAQLRTTPVVRQEDASGEVRLLGRVEPNEETLKNITAWIGGRIDRLHVNTTGQRVQAGQRVATLYSPEVYAAHQDLITAASQRQRMSSGSEGAQRAAQAALTAARQRLSLLGLPSEEIARMESQDKPTTAVSIRSPFSGTVLERLATEGSYVTTGARLYRVADLGSLWIELDAYERDLPLLSINQEVNVEVEAYPGETFRGKVTFIEPTLDQRLRTSKVRVVVKNEDGRLRPGMFAQAVVASAPRAEGAPLVVPSSAVLFTGRRAIVYVEVPGDDRLSYEARTVRLGPRLGEAYPVVAGLAEGERVVTRGAFALDADLQIKGGASMMMSPDDRTPGTWNDVIHISDSELRSLRSPTTQYLKVQQALAADDLGAASQSAAALRATLADIELDSSAEVAKAWGHVQNMISGGAQHITQADSLEQARKGFEHLSGAFIMLLRIFGNPMDFSLSVAHCPMARGSEGANWIQEGAKIENSYFGESMRSCGDIQDHLPPRAHLEPPAPRESRPVARPAEGHQH